MKLNFLLLAFLLAGSSLCAQNENKAPPSKNNQPAPKIAVIDMQQVFENYYKTKQYAEKLKQQDREAQLMMEKMNESRLKLKNEFNEARTSATDILLKDEEREKKRLLAKEKYAQWQEKELECEDQYKRLESQQKNAFTIMRTEIIKEITSVIQSRCLTEGYILVMDSSGRTLNDLSCVVYYSKSIDLTESILSELNKGQITTSVPQK